MKWLVAMASGVSIFILIILLIFVFNSIMKIQVEKWMHSSVMLGVLPRLAVSLDSFLMRNIFFVVPSIFIACLTGAFIVAARKK